MELPNTLELIERTVYHAIRTTAVQAGYIPDITNYDIQNVDTTIARAAELAYENALKDIVTQKGFAIEVFGNSVSQQRGVLKVPRIVLETESFLPGEIGLDTTKSFKRLEDGNYQVNQYMSLTSEFFFKVRLISNTTKQGRVLNGIMLKTFPRRGYIKWWGDPLLKYSQNILINYLSHSEFNWQDEGIVEKIFRYGIPDLQEMKPDARGTVPPIIDIDIKNINVN